MNQCDVRTEIFREAKIRQILTEYASVSKHTCETWCEREREIRFVGCPYTRKKNIHAQFAQNLRSQPFNRDRREHRKRNNVLTEIYKFFCNTTSLPEKAFISHMLPIADSLFLHPAHIVSQKQVQVEYGSVDALDVSIMNSQVPSASIDECLH